MDIYEKAKAYYDAIRKADDIRKGNCETPFVYSQGLFEYLFPLEESEDERIRKELLGFLRNIPNSNYTCEEMALWLEKQGEEKTVNYPIEGMYPYTDPADTLDGEIENIWNKLRNCDNTFTAAKSGFYEVIHHFANWLEKQGEQTKIEALRTEYEKGRADTIAEMKSSWSEEDEVKINRIVDCLENLNVADNDILLKDVDWLKSLKPQNRWKPSEGQIKVCKEVYADLLSAKGFNICTVNNELNRLEKQLKKLTE